MKSPEQDVEDQQKPLRRIDVITTLRAFCTEITELRAKMLEQLRQGSICMTSDEVDFVVKVEPRVDELISPVEALLARAEFLQGTHGRCHPGDVEAEALNKALLAQLPRVDALAPLVRELIAA